MKVLSFLLFSVFVVGEHTPNPHYLNKKLHYRKKAQAAPTYSVNLDLPPIARWTEALDHFNHSEVKQGFDQLFQDFFPSKLLRKLIIRLANELDHFIPAPFADELRGLSHILKVDLGKIVLGNIIYDLTAFRDGGVKACTSIVAVDRNNTIIHGRNLDYATPARLKPLTFQAQFIRNGKPLYMATTYAGYIGVITGARHGAFSLSGNERDKGSFLENLLSALEDSWPTFFLLRTVLEKSTDYKSALNLLTSLPTISPVYFIIGGIRPEEGAIIVNNRWNVLNVTSINNRWFLLETNYDPWNKPPSSDDRRDAGIAAMNAVGRDNMDATHLYEVKNHCST